MQDDLLIHNGVIVTVDSGFTIIPRGRIHIRGGRIEKVEPEAPGGSPAGAVKTGRTIDANGGIVLPGLVNTHSHLPMTLFRGLADDLPLSEWLEGYIFPAEARHLNPDSVLTGALLGCAEMLLSGTTTCCDGYFYENEVAEALERAGMRGVLAQGVVDFPAPGVPDPKKNVDHAVSYIRAWRHRSERILPSIFCHSPYTCSEETLKRGKHAATENGVLFQIHVAETESEKEQMFSRNRMSPVRYLDALGILDPNTLLVHAIWVDDEDIKMISASGAAVSHTAGSSMKLASGVAPVPAFLNAGIRVGIGTDGSASSNHLDLFQEMGLISKLHKVYSLDPTMADAQTVLRMATIEGARAVGLADVIGSIEAGKAADIVILDTRKPHMTPMYHPVSHVVYCANGADVTDVVVAGKIVVRNRQLLTVDVEDIMRRSAELAKKIGSTFG